RRPSERPHARPLAKSSSGSPSPSQPRKWRSGLSSVAPTTASRSSGTSTARAACSRAASRSSVTGPSAYPFPIRPTMSGQRVDRQVDRALGWRENRQLDARRAVLVQARPALLRRPGRRQPVDEVVADEPGGSLEAALVEGCTQAL